MGRSGAPCGHQARVDCTTAKEPFSTNSLRLGVRCAQAGQIESAFAVVSYIQRPAPLHELGIVLKLQETKDAMLLQGAEVVYTTPEEFDRFQRAEIQKWSKVIRDAKLLPQ